MSPFGLQMEIRCDIRQPEFAQRQEISCQKQRIHMIVAYLSVQLPERSGTEEIHIEVMYVVSYKYVVACKVQEIFQGILQRGLVQYHFIRNTVDGCGSVRNRPSRIYQRGENAVHLSVPHLYCGYLYDLVLFRAQACGFQVKYHIVLCI